MPAANGGDASVAMEPGMSGDSPDISAARSHWREGRDLAKELRYEVAQLDLLGSRSLRQTALSLTEAHEKEATRALLTNRAWTTRPGSGLMTLSRGLRPS